MIFGLLGVTTTYKLNAPSIVTRPSRIKFGTEKHENSLGARELAGDHDNGIFEVEMSIFG